MLKKEAQNLVVSYLEDFLKDDGYKYNKSLEQVVANKGDFSFHIAPEMTDYHPEYSFSFVFRIRHKGVEKIANETSCLNPENYKYSNTVGILHIYFTGESNRVWKRYIIKEKEDLNQIKEFFPPLYTSKIKPFFESFDSLEKLLAFIDKSIQISNGSVYVNANLYRRCIILLKLTGSPEFENRAATFREIIKDSPDFVKKDFESTYEYLKTL